MTSSLYDNINSNDLESNKEYSRLYQPNLTVTRQTYKGKRDSEKVNLEINQIMFDLLYIQSQIEEIERVQEEVYTALRDGYIPVDGSEWPYITDDSEFYNQGTIADLDIMSEDGLYTYLHDMLMLKQITLDWYFYG
jgi:hypothetical protein